jgi:putative copper resistance protein D
MIVHLLMIMVVPAFAVWAQPIRLLCSVADARMRRVAKWFRVERISRWLIIPWITVPLYAVVLVGTHLTGFQQVMMQHMWLHSLELAIYLLSGYLLLLPILGGEPTALAVPPMLRFVILALCMGPDTLVGVVLMLTGSPLAPAYAAHRDWGPSALADQSAAGAIMWWGGDGIMMIFMLIVAAQWVASAPDNRGGLGTWVERIRQQTLLGTDTEIDVDDDVAALDAYNARLAALHGLPPSDAAPKNEGPALGR